MEKKQHSKPPPVHHFQADVMIAGGSEAAMTPLCFAGFCSMRAMVTSFNDDPTSASRPFDKDRAGFVMGEGAGVLILETEEHALARGATIYCEVRRYMRVSDAGKGRGVYRWKENCCVDRVSHVHSIVLLRMPCPYGGHPDLPTPGEHVCGRSEQRTRLKIQKNGRDWKMRLARTARAPAKAVLAVASDHFTLMK